MYIFFKKASGLFVYNVTINNNLVVQWRSDLLVKEISINLYKPLTCRNSMAKLSYKNVWNKGNNKITELRTILQRESPNS